MKKIILLMLVAQIAGAQGPTLLKNINPGAGLSSNPSGFTFFNGITYFNADNGTTGKELWKTDGTLGGTQLLLDINSGSSGSNPRFFVVAGGNLFFTADDGVNGLELWKSDGTAGGTMMVKNINPSGSANIGSLFVLGSKVYFAANDGTSGTELWSSDGTAANTAIVKNINPVSGAGSDPSDMFMAVGGSKFYFTASDGTNGTELWVSDGTTSGTSMVANINPAGDGLTSSLQFVIANYNGKTYFTANDGVGGNELYVTDGTSAGTTLVKEINPAGGSTPAYFQTYNGNLFFTCDDGVNGREFWKTDGTSANTVIVKNTNPTPATGNAAYPLLTASNKLLFIADDGTHGFELWISDGTTGGTNMVTDINTGLPQGITGLPIVVGNKIIFQGNDGTNGKELWQSDGTAAGTMMYTPQINPSTGNGNPAGYAVSGNRIYMSADDGTSGNELFVLENATGVNEVLNVGSFRAYPNPAIGSFTISAEMEAGNSFITIADLNGRNIFSGTEENAVFTRNVQLNAEAGIYFVTVSNANGRITSKLVIE